MSGCIWLSKGLSRLRHTFCPNTECGPCGGIGRCEDFWTYARDGSGRFPVLINLMKPVSWCWRPASRSASSISEQVGQIGASRKYKPVSAPHLKHVAMTAPILHRAYGRPRAKSIGQRQALHAKDTPRHKHRGYPEILSGNQVAGDGGCYAPLLHCDRRGNLTRSPSHHQARSHDLYAHLNADGRLSTLVAQPLTLLRSS